MSDQRRAEGEQMTVKIDLSLRTCKLRSVTIISVAFLIARCD